MSPEIPLPPSRQTPKKKAKVKQEKQKRNFGGERPSCSTDNKEMETQENIVLLIMTSNLKNTFLFKFFLALLYLWYLLDLAHDDLLHEGRVHRLVKDRSSDFLLQSGPPDPRPPPPTYGTTGPTPDFRRSHCISDVMKCVDSQV